MFGLCSHKWEVVNRKFTPPFTNLKHFKNASEEFADKIMFGFTTIEEKCILCGKVHFIQTSGDQRDGKDLES